MHKNLYTDLQVRKKMGGGNSQPRNHGIVQAITTITTYFLLFGFLKAVITPFRLNPQLPLVT